MLHMEVDAHTHSIVSGHAYGTLTEMAKGAAERGIKLLGITEHTGYMPGTCHDIYFRNLRVVPRQMFGIELLLGCETNIVDTKGHVDLCDDIRRTLDLCIASIHPNIPYRVGDIDQNTAALIGAIRDPLVDIIGHPNDGRHPVDYEKIVLAAGENHTLLEINNSSLKAARIKNGFENACTIARLCKKYGVPVSADSDAHYMADIGNTDFSTKVFEEVDFPHELILTLSAERFKAFLKENRKRR